MRPLPSLSFTLRAECVKQFTGSGDKTGSVEPKNQPAVKKKSPYRTAPPWRASSNVGGWLLLRRDRRAAHPGTRASDVTGREDSGASSPVSCRPTHLQSSIFLSLSFPPPSVLSTSRLLSPQPPSSPQSTTLPATPMNGINQGRP